MKKALYLLPRLVKVLILLPPKQCLCSQTFSQTKTGLFLTSQVTHDLLLVLEEAEKHIAKS